jgi:hypothetical protein
MNTPKQVRDASTDAVEIKDLLDHETYYSLNLVCVLTEATQQERDVIRNMMTRARAARCSSRPGSINRIIR